MPHSLTLAALRSLVATIASPATLAALHTHDRSAAYHEERRLYHAGMRISWPPRDRLRSQHHAAQAAVDWLDGHPEAATESLVRAAMSAAREDAASRLATRSATCDARIAAAHRAMDMIGTCPLEW